MTAATQISHICKRQYNCGDTDRSHRHLLCKCRYNYGDTDHSHRQFLYKRQYNCDGTNQSHRHLLCKCQYNCGDTDHPHRHFLCKCQYNCGDNGSTSHAFRTTPDALATVESLTADTQTVADGCERLRTVAHTDTTFREHSLTPRPPNETGTFATHSGKICATHVTFSQVEWQTGLKIPTLRIHGLHTNATYVPLRSQEVLVSRPGTSGGWQECVLNRFLDANPDYPFRFIQFTNLLSLGSTWVTAFVCGYGAKSDCLLWSH